MRRAFALSLCFALASMFLSGDALAKSHKRAPAPPPAAESDDFPIPLPKELTSNLDWLNDGAGDPATGNLQPNAHANDNYFLEQQDFRRNDPTRFTEMGTIFDGW